jgi:hypothetical protein
LDKPIAIRDSAQNIGLLHIAKIPRQFPFCDMQQVSDIHSKRSELLETSLHIAKNAKIDGFCDVQ